MVTGQTRASYHNNTAYYDRTYYYKKEKRSCTYFIVVFAKYAIGCIRICYWRPPLPPIMYILYVLLIKLMLWLSCSF